jgi:hypothetical protein
MSLKVVGAGFGRTGTFSLKLALEKLCGGPCYHMYEVFQHPQDIAVWHRAALNQPVDWQEFMAPWTTAVDLPVSAFWKELSQAFPESLILLSMRDPESWWESANSTIFKHIPQMRNENPEWLAMMVDCFKTRFPADMTDKQSCIDAFNRHNDNVLENAPKDRLLVWEAKEGWAPICSRLGIPIPDEPFPRANTKEDFVKRMEGHETAEA